MIVAAYQGFSPEGNIESALAKVDETLAKAADKNVEMVVFPEPVSYTHLTLPTKA